MDALTLSAAQTIVTAALAHARAANFKPMGVAVLDARGALKAFAAEERTSLYRGDIAIGKASGALAMGMGSRTLAKRPPQFLNALAQIVPRGLVPVPGGVLIRDAEGEVIGAVGISGDASELDEAAAIAGIEAAGFVADPGAD